MLLQLVVCISVYLRDQYSVGVDCVLCNKFLWGRSLGACASLIDLAFAMRLKPNTLIG